MFDLLDGGLKIGFSHVLPAEYSCSFSTLETFFGRLKNKFGGGLDIILFRVLFLLLAIPSASALFGVHRKRIQW